MSKFIQIKYVPAKPTAWPDAMEAMRHDVEQPLGDIGVEQRTTCTSIEPCAFGSDLEDHRRDPEIEQRMIEAADQQSRELAAQALDHGKTAAAHLSQAAIQTMAASYLAIQSAWRAYLAQIAADDYKPTSWCSAPFKIATRVVVRKLIARTNEERDQRDKKESDIQHQIEEASGYFGASSMSSGAQSDESDDPGGTHWMF